MANFGKFQRTDLQVLWQSTTGLLCHLGTTLHPLQQGLDLSLVGGCILDTYLSLRDSGYSTLCDIILKLLYYYT